MREHNFYAPFLTIGKISLGLNVLGVTFLDCSEVDIFGVWHCKIINRLVTKKYNEW